MAQSVTAKHRDYVMTADPRRFRSTIPVIQADLFLLSSGNYLLLSDGNDLAIRGGSTVQSPLVTARHRDYVMTAPERE